MNPYLEYIDLLHLAANLVSSQTIIISYQMPYTSYDKG